MLSVVVFNHNTCECCQLSVLSVVVSSSVIIIIILIIDKGDSGLVRKFLARVAVLGQLGSRPKEIRFRV